MTVRISRSVGGFRRLLAGWFTGLLLAGLLTVWGTTGAQATPSDGITFSGVTGTSAPPSTLGRYHMEGSEPIPNRCLPP